MPTVDFERSLLVGSSPAAVWGKLTDPDVVAGWVTVVGDVEEIEPLAHYAATLNDRLGPFRLSADLDITVTDIEEPRRITFLADGEDRQVASRIQVRATMALTESDSATDIHVKGQYEVTGRVATLGASMIRTKGEKMLEEFFTAASRELG
jgi:carbon monoxide dehydrogenase subunit G